MLNNLTNGNRNVTNYVFEKNGKNKVLYGKKIILWILQ